MDFIVIKIIGLIFQLFSILLFKKGIKYEDNDAAGYLTKIRLIGCAVLLLIGSIAFLFTDKNLCQIFPDICFINRPDIIGLLNQQVL